MLDSPPDLPADAGKVIALPRLSEPRTPLCLRHFDNGTAGREVLESFIRTVYARSYGARITTFYPRLISLTRPDESLAAVAGIRAAAADRLFAEQYLDAPIEAVIIGTGAQAVERSGIVEVGNLAPADAGQARWLIATITAYLHACGFRWVVFTAVPALRNAFMRMGLQPLHLASASVARLDPAHQDDWGSYYAGEPQVYAGDIALGFRAISAMLSADLPRLRDLWQAAQNLATPPGGEAGLLCGNAR